MAYQTRVFIDFWNFQLNWRDRAAGAKIDWPAVPRVLIEHAGTALAAAGISGELTLEETLVYASYNGRSPSDRKLKGWLDSFLDRQSSFRVKTRERTSTPRKIRCQACETETVACPSCGAGFVASPEKGVDSAIVTDLLSLAFRNAFEVAILVSSDADFVPAVEVVQESGLKVVNATWSKHGFHLAKTCWASLELDGLIPEMTR